MDAKIAIDKLRGNAPLKFGDDYEIAALIESLEGALKVTHNALALAGKEIKSLEQKANASEKALGIERWTCKGKYKEEVCVIFLAKYNSADSDCPAHDFCRLRAGHREG